MNKIVRLEIFGNPVPQGRPRFFRKGNFIGAYDPEKSRSWKENVRLQAIMQKPEIMTGALNLFLHFKLLKPKSMSKKVIHHVKKPDLDNLVKACKDALKGICYRDDSQIIELAAKKEYSEKPGVVIVISEII